MTRICKPNTNVGPVISTKTFQAPTRICLPKIGIGGNTPEGTGMISFPGVGVISFPGVGPIYFP